MTNYDRVERLDREKWYGFVIEDSHGRITNFVYKKDDREYFITNDDLDPGQILLEAYGLESIPDGIVIRDVTLCNCEDLLPRHNVDVTKLDDLG